jgi:hypothetical protein
MTTQKTLSELARKVRCDATYGAKLDWDKQDEWQQQATGYSVTLHYKGRQYTTDFWMGSAHTSEPDAEGVLECLLSDSHAADYSFEEFCGEMGYDTDSRKAERIWKQCAKVRENMERLLGDDFETFLYADRN